MKIRARVSDRPIRKPAVAVVGTWDPLVPAHRELFQRLAEYGREQELVPVVMILFPAPVRLVNRDPTTCLEYTDLEARIAMIRECADVKVLVIGLNISDLDAPCRSFFDLVHSHIRLRELWLGSNQSLGRGPQGSDAAITALAKRRRIVLRRLEHTHASALGAPALRLLGAGKVKEASEQIGYAPIWKRPRSGVLHLNWPAGKYVTVPMNRPSLAWTSGTAPIPVELSSGAKAGQGRLEWPRRDVRWLRFIEGPADATASA